jgi:hypothetical protein
MNTDSILKILNAERNVLAKQLAALDQAVNALGGRNGPRKARRQLSAQARAKIVAAQKKRWAAWWKKQS